MINKDLLKEMIDKKLVDVQKHPTADLFIYNYSPTVQYEKLWNEITLQTRGLILDAEMNVIARPFKKFFNLEEHQPEDIPLEHFDVTDKLDGSLGITYHLNGVPFIATRGSFTSEQALHATEILHNKYGHLLDRLDKDKTYLFEIIYRDNRIVVDYGDIDDLFLLSIICNKTGEEFFYDIGFPMTKKYDGIRDINTLRQIQEDNKEGFVIRFKSGFRVKIKFDEYVRLHRILTGVSNIAIWEYLRDGLPFDELLDKVPDEFYNWVKLTITQLQDKYNEILNEAKSNFKELESRKETAFYFQTQKYPSVMFALLDGKSPDKLIWRMIRPKFSKAFKIEN